MKIRHLNLIVALFAFVAGSFFLLSNQADIDANVIGASGPQSALSSIAGIFLIVIAAAFFVTVAHYQSSHPSLEDNVGGYFRKPATSDHEDLSYVKENAAEIASHEHSKNKVE